MGRTCCIIGCNVRSHDRQRKKVANGLSFYSFPAWKKSQGNLVSEVTRRRRMAWISAVRRKDITFADISKWLKVCSRHFHSGKPAYEMNELHPDWAPSLHLGYSEDKVSDWDACTQHRYSASMGGDQTKQRSMNENESDEVQAETGAVEKEEHELKEEEHECKEEAEAVEGEELGEQTEMDEPAAKRKKTEWHFCVQSNAEITHLLQENRELRSAMNKFKMDEEFFKDDTEKVEYYTGFPYFAILLSMFTTVKPFLPPAKKLSQFQMVLLTLIRLRLDLPVHHLSYLFNATHKTFSTTFAETINVLHAHLAPLHWPERRCLLDTMPHQFLEAFGKRVAIIVDCFEIHIESLSDLKARAHTMKYLVGITPQGQISFLSKGWGGQASDKYITENCGLLNKLLPGDVVLADRGFDIKESLGMMCAEVQIPAFTTGRCQLDIKDVEDTHATTHLRMHVEKVMDSLRNKYTLLKKTQPISMLLPSEDDEFTLLDKIVNVCCKLVNMCPSVVKPDETATCAC
ncbi:uncharacterized protein LOC121635838 [Melanotaenia boesemani]|uniref:uncharacterized protein LOC121635838 n=1 Tax=Melanotaenia boesemani TaxID=1250792 RepID=UPI001C05760C|nr:uncharacterized protein LOC121635838 [Melanotaenia boesemani]